MSNVTPAMVKELRERTGAGMADCKKALDQAQGDMEQAIIGLRERGLAAAAKKAGRAASEGVVAAAVAPSQTKGFLVEVNCETDFVTRNEDFQGFVAKVQSLILQKEPQGLEDLLNLPFDGGQLKDAVANLVAKIGENIQVRRYARLGTAETVVTSYIHGPGKVGVLVELAGNGVSNAAHREKLNDLAKDVALQVAAMKPQFLDKTRVPQDVIKSESEVFANQYRNQGKPENIIPKIVASRVETWFKEACLLEQSFVKEENKSVQAHVADVARGLGIADLRVVDFVRMELGQGVEKNTTDFATEVAAQIAAAR